MQAQHEEIDRLNAQSSDGFRVLKGIEADIRPDGSIDYTAELLDRFDYVIASVHSRFNMDRATMTARVLRTLDDPHARHDPQPSDGTPVAWPGGGTRSTLRRSWRAQPRAASRSRSTLIRIDWISTGAGARRAAQLGAQLIIGPDAHSVAALDNVALGVVVARKAWLQPSNLLASDLL